MNARRLAAPTLALALGLGLAACGGDDDDAAGTTVATTAAAPTTTAPAGDGTAAGTAAAVELNEADVAFAQGMIAHHEQALEMAEIALDPTVGASPEVVDLATRVQAAQEPEIELLTGWLDAAGEPVTMDMSDGHDMSEMDGMMSTEDMDALSAATGTEFDTMWLEMMIAHHEGAIAQSETEQADGANPDAIALAGQIITAQTAEIEEMQALLDA